MSNLVDFLTSKQIILIYIVAFLACLVCFIIYLIEKNNKKLRLRHNTRELNKLVEEVREEANIIVEQKEEDIKQEPVLIPMEELKDDEKKQPIREEIIIDQNALNQTKKEEELEYTSIEPDQKTAKLELEKLKAELKRQEELKLKEIEKEEIKKKEEKIEEHKQEEIDHSKIKEKYEDQQEKNAIISLEELVQKSKDLYEANELTQYLDEGNEPISLKELENRVGKTSTIEETFELEKAIPKEEITQIEKVEPVKKKVILDDFETTKTNKKFKNSPIISPIYGIEKDNKGNDMELENTADYDKLDAEIKKTNEFLMTLKELQKKLD